MGERKSIYRVLAGKPEEGDHWEDPSVNGRIILRWIFSKWYGGHELDRAGPRQGQVTGTC